MKIKTEPKILRRALATIIDYGLYYAFSFWLVITYGEPNDEGGHSLNDIRAVWIFIVWFAYFPVMESVRGQTLGKLILGMKVVTLNGNPISFGQAFKRRLLDIIDFFSFAGLVAILAVKYTADHQRLGDLVAKTMVIGGDTYRCSNCSEELSVSPDDLIKGSYKCPVCGVITDLQTSGVTNI